MLWKKAARTNLEGGVKSPGRPIIALPPPKDDRDIFPSVCGSVRPGRRFDEPSGRQIVLEIIDGKCVFYENNLGVLTNSPSFDWQLTNLNNYVNLLPGRTELHTLGNMSLSSFGGGSAMLGLPGDFTPPSRFVRAA